MANKAKPGDVYRARAALEKDSAKAGRIRQLAQKMDDAAASRTPAKPKKKEKKK